MRRTQEKIKKWFFGTLLGTLSMFHFFKTGTNWNKLAYAHFLTHMVAINLYVNNITLACKASEEDE